MGSMAVGVLLFVAALIMTIIFDPAASISAKVIMCELYCRPPSILGLIGNIYCADVFSTVLLSIPFGLALEPAQTSSRCDDLTASLNKLVLADADNFARVDAVVITLLRENNGQGVGVRTPTH